jgi:hypothetical protein
MTWITDYCRNTTKIKKSAQSTINKMVMVLETLRKGVKDPQEVNSFHPDTTGIQIQ